MAMTRPKLRQFCGKGKYESSG